MDSLIAVRPEHKIAGSGLYPKKGEEVMQYGICCEPSLAGTAAQAGFDYYESTVGALLKPLESDQEFRSSLELVRKNKLPCPAVNVFVPAALKITGPTADLAALKSYVSTTCERAEAAGVHTIVFGSGGARRIPDGFERAIAWGQLVAFCQMLAPIAERHDVTIAIEPLNQAECNVLTSVGECARLVREVDQPAVRLLVDAYHLLKDGDSLDDVVTNGSLLEHVHVATIPSRLAPGMEPCDLGPFFKALLTSGYSGRVSIEGKLPDSAQELHQSLQWMKNLAA
jgi:sugar phosphate isomerase/epimerase